MQAEGFTQEPAGGMKRAAVFLRSLRLLGYDPEQQVLAEFSSGALYRYERSRPQRCRPCSKPTRWAAFQPGIRRSITATNASE